MPVKIFISIQRNFSYSLKQSKGVCVEKGKKKYKVSVVRRTFYPTGVRSLVKEWKAASSVVKQFNWENKHLFGPVQTSKKNSYDKRKIEESNLIIQHATQIPIIEPNALELTSNNKSDDFDFNCILDFPLMNKSQGSQEDFAKRIKKCNILRTYLEQLGSAVPSVSLILEKTMPQDRVDILERWRQRMMQQLGEEGFQKYQAEILANGSSLHESINAYLSSASREELVIKDENFGHWKSLKSVFPAISEVKLLEEHVFHPFLRYRGVVDCFAKYKDQLVVIDWKTSKKCKRVLKSLYDSPLQIAAYAGALNFDRKYQYLIGRGVIVVAYESGVSASVHFLDEQAMQQYWRQWLERLNTFWRSQATR